MALGSAQDENRTNKIASWPDGFTMRAVFDVKKRKSVLKLIVALSLVVVGVGADDKCGETQHYREDRSARPSAGQLQAGHGAGALQAVREIHGRTEQPVSLWTPEHGPLSAALGTATNSPGEYGPHWAGFGKRY